jgi:hypothetical protein
MTSVYQGLARFGGHIRKSGGQALGTRLDYNKIVKMISKEDFETGMRNNNSETIKYFTVEDVY